MADLPDFLVIPSEILNRADLTLLDGYLYGVIYWFNMLALKKCTLSNDALAEMLQVDTRSVQRSLNRLEKAEYISIKYASAYRRTEIIPLLKMGKWDTLPTKEEMEEFNKLQGMTKMSPSTTLESPQHDTGVAIARHYGHQNKRINNIEREGDIKSPRPSKNYNYRDYLLNIPLEDFEYLKKDTSATDAQVKRKGEELYNWLLSTNKKKSNHRAFLRNAVIRDFPIKEDSKPQYKTLEQLKKEGTAWY